MDDVSCLPVRRRSLPSPYAAMCLACFFSSFLICSCIHRYQHHGVYTTVSPSDKSATLQHKSMEVF